LLNIKQDTNYKQLFYFSVKIQDLELIIWRNLTGEHSHSFEQNLLKLMNKHTVIPLFYINRFCEFRFPLSNSSICTLQGYYAVSSGNSLPTFQVNLLVPSSRVNKSKKTVSKKVVLKHR